MQTHPRVRRMPIELRLPSLADAQAPKCVDNILPLFVLAVRTNPVRVGPVTVRSGGVGTCGGLFALQRLLDFEQLFGEEWVHGVSDLGVRCAQGVLEFAYALAELGNLFV